jgi:hypothetical protein
MEERDQVWKYEDNLFFGFKCKYYLKEFRGRWSYKFEVAFS